MNRNEKRGLHKNMISCQLDDKLKHGKLTIKHLGESHHDKLIIQTLIQVTIKSHHNPQHTVIKMITIHISNG